MPIQIQLHDMSASTQFAPLGVLGYCLTQTNFLKEVFASIEFTEKTVNHKPEAKLQDALVSILAGCRALSTINTRIRPELALAQAWGREQFAEQSSVARTLDKLNQEQVEQLRLGSDKLFKRESFVLNHDFTRTKLWLDLDLTPLPTSKHAEGSQKGKISDKKTAMVGNSPD